MTADDPRPLDAGPLHLGDFVRAPGLHGDERPIGENTVLASGFHVESIGIPRADGTHTAAVVLTLTGRRNRHPDEDDLTLVFVFPADGGVQAGRDMVRASTAALRDVAVADGLN